MDGDHDSKLDTNWQAQSALLSSFNKDSKHVIGFAVRQQDLGPAAQRLKHDDSLRGVASLLLPVTGLSQNAKNISFGSFSTSTLVLINLKDLVNSAKEPVFQHSQDSEPSV